ncbi:hypothetical protein PACTADRAFT_49064 [Pachysolen tannophilus NRRL Y-2460]|uniref:Uncharacterized protein n=1 Tax=Pachysolen tannophilus NRRL Y-2460 TaxID=669874 RepID=A0A1E4U004_PACTA|nr:hypothetical protein PACTADRAFT_49064 [Pachysolen tannophilus NRRL Y-2460]
MAAYPTQTHILQDQSVSDILSKTDNQNLVLMPFSEQFDDVDKHIANYRRYQQNRKTFTASNNSMNIQQQNGFNKQQRCIIQPAKQQNLFNVQNRYQHPAHQQRSNSVSPHYQQPQQHQQHQQHQHQAPRFQPQRAQQVQVQIQQQQPQQQPILFSNSAANILTNNNLSSTSSISSTASSNFSNFSNFTNSTNATNVTNPPVAVAAATTAANANANATGPVSIGGGLGLAGSASPSFTDILSPKFDPFAVGKNVNLGGAFANQRNHLSSVAEGVNHGITEFNLNSFADPAVTNSTSATSGSSLNANTYNNNVIFKTSANNIWGNDMSVWS